jgi:hypothetical protein
MQPLKIFNIKRAITKVKYITEGHLVVVDEENTVRIFDLNELKLDGGFKVKLPKNRVFSNSVDISQNGEYLVFTIPKTNKAILWQVNTRKPSANLGWHKGEIESVAFDIQNKYVATGGTDGRAYIWNVKTGKMVGTLAPHADYVTAIGFSKNGYWCATGSYDKSISITNISSMQFAYKLRVHSTMVTKIKFLSNFKMVSGDKEGNILISDYTKGRVVKRVQKLPDIALDFTFDTDEKYMFATTKNKNIFLYDMQNYELITDKFIEVTSTITSIDFVPEMMYLIIGTVDGILYVYDILSDEKQLEKYIEQKKYADAYSLIEENPLLKNSITYSKLEKIWENLISKAQTLLEQGQKDVVKQILQPFLSVPSKRMFVQQLLKDFAEFDKFKMLVLKKKYPLAYSLANKYPSFKDTKYYKHMENEWKKVFNIARQLIFEKNKEDYVKQILMPFRGVAEKTPLIQALFNEKEIYKLLKQKLAKKDFTGFFELIHRYPFLADLDEYKEAINFGEKLLNIANESIKKGNYATVLKYVNILKDFPMYQKDAEEILHKANVLVNFMKYIANKEYDKVYKYVKQEPFLENVDDFKKLEDEWQKKVAIAEEYSAKGDVAHIIDSLKNYMKIEEKIPKITEIIKTAYLYQILEKLKSENLDNEVVQKAFNRYIKLFGLDPEIGDIIEFSKKAGYKLDFSNIQEGDNFNWLHEDNLPVDIFSESV